MKKTMLETIQERLKESQDALGKTNNPDPEIYSAIYSLTEAVSYMLTKISALEKQLEP